MGRTKRMGPLTVQQPFYPEKDVCHMYLLHPPGGLVGGDRLDLDIKLEPKAHVFMTTPGAAKFYRSQGSTAVQAQQFSVKTGAVFEWFPQETILFDKAIAEIDTTIKLEKDAVFMGWDILCLGQPVRHSRFESGKLLSKLRMERHGVPLFLDRLEISGSPDLDAVTGLKGNCVTAVFLATGVDPELFGLIREKTQDKGLLSGMTLLDDLLVVRTLADCPQKVRRVYEAVRSMLRLQLLNKPADRPRIWNT